MAISVMTIAYVYDQIELSVEKLQQDLLLSFSSFPVDFVNGEEIYRQQLFSGLHIDNDVSVEEIVLVPSQRELSLVAMT